VCLLLHIMHGLPLKEHWRLCASYVEAESITAEVRLVFDVIAAGAKSATHVRCSLDFHTSKAHFRKSSVGAGTIFGKVPARRLMRACLP